MTDAMELVWPVLPAQVQFCFDIDQGGEGNMAQWSHTHNTSVPYNLSEGKKTRSLMIYEDKENKKQEPEKKACKTLLWIGGIVF